jgi:ribonuclease HI
MLYVFCDGACSANGRAGAAGAFAVVVCGGPGGAATISAPLAAAEYRFADGLPAIAVAAAPEASAASEASEATEASAAPATSEAAAPPATNNRAELLALAWALAVLPRLGEPAATVVSDSKICVRTLNEWLPSRRARGTEGELRNLDLVRTADAALAAARAAGVAVTIEHQRGHQPMPDREDGRAYLYWVGNDRADRAAVAAVGGALRIEGWGAIYEALKDLG